MTLSKKLQLTILGLCCMSTSLLSCKTALAQSNISIDLNAAKIEGAAAPAVLKQTVVNFQVTSLAGIELTMKHRDNAWNSLQIPVKVDQKQFNTLQFKAHWKSGVAANLNAMSIRVVDAKGNWALTAFSKHNKDLGNGWCQFSWDMINQPDVRIAANLDELTRVDLRYPFSKVAENAPDVLEVADMQFVTGQSVKSGDPQLFAEWQKFITNYKPDYSDSSKYLLPPETGRIASPIPFNKDGKALGEIVLPQNASAPLAMAGHELHHWLQEITKADVPIVAMPSNNATPKVLLGTQFAAGKFDADVKYLTDTDGFAVRTDGKNVSIFGATDKGTLNGVYAFLENNTDIIWPRPQSELSVIFTPHASLDITWADSCEKPATRLRGWGEDLGIRGADVMWMTRNRNNYISAEGTSVKEDVLYFRGLGDSVQLGGGHNISGFLGKNPAFYPTIDGKKVLQFNIWKNQPNFTAPGITDAVAENVIAYIKKVGVEDIDCVNINIEDNWGVSADPQSIAPITLPDGTIIKSDDPAFRSTQYFIFLTEVVQKINETYPNMMVSTYAYFFTATVPKIALDPHIRIFFAPYPRKDYRSPMFSPINDHWWRQMVGWTQKTPNLVMREYYGISNGFRPLAEVVDAEVKSYVDRGITQYTAELMPDVQMIWSDNTMRGDRESWDFMAMDYWIINRIYWDPNQNVEQLRKYFLRRTFHEAAPQMENFFGTIRTEWYKNTDPSNFVDSIPLFKQMIIDGGLEDQLRADFREAAKVVKNPTSRLMIDEMQITFDKWAAQAKASKPADKPEYKFTPDVQLLYGWQSNTNWEQRSPAWANATVIDQNGKAAPALRLTTQSAYANGKDFTITNSFDPGLLLMKSGDTLEFTISPTDKESSAPLQISLTAIDKNNQKVLLPNSAIEKLPDGSLHVKWQLQSDEKFDVTQIKQLQLTIPNAVCAGKMQSIFYITDISLEHAAQ